MSLFGQKSNFGSGGGGSLFGNNQNPSQTSSLFSGNNTTNAGTNNKPGLFGSNSNPTTFSFGNNTGTNNIFGGNNNNNPNPSSTSLFGANNLSINTNNQTNNIKVNQPSSFLGQTNNPSPFNFNNNQPQQQNNTNPNNNFFNTNPQGNNTMNQFQNQYMNLNDPRLSHDLEEYKQLLNNINNCTDPSCAENMFKDYLYMPIPKGRQPNEYNIYRPYTYIDGQKKIINDYKIWDIANKNNKDPNKFFPIQISSVDSLLTRYKTLEKGILVNIAKNVETQKNLENLNKKIDDEMSNKLYEIKNCHTKLNKLQLSLSSKVAQYNYLLGTARENINDTQQIKENIKKADDNINNNNIIELSEQAKKMSNEEFEGENKDYIKEINKEKINYMIDALIEIQGMMNVVNTNNKKNLNIVKGMQKEVERILKKNEL
jgi:hypothetical protein